MPAPPSETRSPVAPWVVLSATLGIFLFYLIGAGFFIDIFTADELLKGSPPSKSLSSGYSQLLVWAGASFAAAGVALLIAAYGFSSLNSLVGLYRKWGLYAYGSLAVLSLVSLSRIGSGPLDAIRQPLCSGGANLCAETDEIPILLGWVINIDLFGAINFAKQFMNGAFQLGALAALMAFLFIKAETRTLEDPSQKSKESRAQFYCAAIILTSIITTDALFYGFIASINGQTSVLSSYYHGHVFFFATISSAVLILVFFAGLWFEGGENILIDFVEQGAGEAASEKSWASTLGGFVGSPSIAQGVATFAPLIAAFIGVWGEAS